MNDLKSKLHEFGLSEKEANVYLAMLELGAASAQDIAKKAGVNRATTYVMFESLKRRGLMSSVERGKKILFAAESPEHLVSVMEQELNSVREKKARLEAAMPHFMGLFNAVEDKPKVRYFEGEEGIVACREAVMGMIKDQHAARVFIHYDKTMVEMAKMNEAQRLKMTGTLSTRLLYSIDPGLDLPTLRSHVQVKRLPSEFQTFHGELNVYETFILIASTTTRPIAVIIESAELTTLFQQLFDVAWMVSE